MATEKGHFENPHQRHENKADEGSQIPENTPLPVGYRENPPRRLTELQVKELLNRTYWKAKGNPDVNTDLLINPIDGKIGRNFGAHGIAKVSYGYQLRSLINFLENGIDPNRPFHDAPLALDSDDPRGSDVAGGTANNTGSFIIVGGFRKPLSEGVRYVLVNDMFYDILDDLQKAYPEAEFIRADKAPDRFKEIVNNEKND